MSKLSDTFRREKEKMQGMTFRKKVEYLIGNWWLEAFGVAVAIAVIAFLINSGINASKTHLLYLAVVDVELSGEQNESNCAAFKAYIGDDQWQHVIAADTNVSSLGGTEVVNEDVTDYQQKSMILIGTGLVDAYICPERYVDFLAEYDEMLPLSEVLNDTQMEAYADCIAHDGFALRIDGTTGAESWNAAYEPAYLVVTRSVHFPEVVRAFVDFTMQ